MKHQKLSFQLNEPTRIAVYINQQIRTAKFHIISLELQSNKESITLLIRRPAISGNFATLVRKT